MSFFATAGQKNRRILKRLDSYGETLNRKAAYLNASVTKKESSEKSTLTPSEISTQKPRTWPFFGERLHQTDS